MWTVSLWLERWQFWSRFVVFAHFVLSQSQPTLRRMVAYCSLLFYSEVNKGDQLWRFRFAFSWDTQYCITRKTFTRCLWKRSSSSTLFCSLHCLIYSSFLLFVNFELGGESGLNHMKRHRSVFYNNFCKVIRKITYLQLEIWHSNKYVGEERNVVLVDAQIIYLLFVTICLSPF